MDGSGTFVRAFRDQRQPYHANAALPQEYALGREEDYTLTTQNDTPATLSRGCFALPVTLRTTSLEKFLIAFFRKAWWRVNVFLLSSISDATLMLDFCEVQHLKLNRRAALVASAEAQIPERRLISRSEITIKEIKGGA